MPPTAEVGEWLNDISHKDTPLPRLTEERTAIDGRPSLRVRYRHVDYTERETLFIVDSSRTFTISFSGEVPGRIEEDPFYAVHRQIVSTFAFTSGNER